MSASLTWYYQTVAGVVGPVSAAELKYLLQQGAIAPTTLIRRGDNGPWHTASRIQPVPGPAVEAEPISGSEDDPAVWYSPRGNGLILGPVPRSVLVAMASQGKLEPVDLAWKPGMASWVPASEFPDLPREAFTAGVRKDAQSGDPASPWFPSRGRLAGAAGVLISLGLIAACWGWLGSGRRDSLGRQPGRADNAPALAGPETQPGLMSAPPRTQPVSTVPSPELRPLSERALLEASRPESNRRQSMPKPDESLVQMPQAVGRVQLVAAAPALPTKGPGLPAPARRSILGSVEPAAVARERARDPKRGSELLDHLAAEGPVTLEAVLAAPKAYEGNRLLLDGVYKVGTQLSQVDGPDGNALGWSLPVGRIDGTTICSGRGTVEGRDRYLLLEAGLVPEFDSVINELKIKTTVKPTYKCILTVTVHPTIANDARAPVVKIVGLEILSACDFLQVAQGQYENAFRTVQIAPEGAFVTYGDGESWIQRLGGKEKFVLPLRHKLHELQRRHPRCFVGRRSVLTGRVISPGSLHP